MVNRFCICFETIFGCLTVLVTLVHVGCTFRRVGGCRGFAYCGRFRREHLLCPRAGTDPIMPYVIQEARSRTLRQGKAFVIPLAHLTFVALIILLINRAMGGQSVQTQAQDSILLLGLISSILSYGFSHLITERTMGAYYHYMMALCAVYGATAVSHQKLLHSCALGYLYRSAISLIYKDVPKLIFWNFVCDGLSTFAFVRKGLDFNDLRNFGAIEVELAELVQFVTLQLQASIILTFLVYFARTEQLGSVRRELEDAASKKVNTAMRSLLDMVCDVTLELDEQLVISNHCKALSALLVLGHGTSLKGRKIEDFMATSEDRLRFSAHMSSVASDITAPVIVLHFSMRDGNGGVVEVEMFSTCFFGMAGELRHLLGVREYTDIISLAPISLGQQLTRSARRRGRNSSKASERGTPKDSERHDLQSPSTLAGSLNVRTGTKTSSSSSGGGDRSSKGSKRSSDEGSLLHAEVLAVPNFAPTADGAIFTALQRSISEVNWQLRRQSCCRRHAYLNQANKYFKVLYHAECSDEFAPAAWRLKQCKQCGLLHEAADVLAASNSWKCYACGTGMSEMSVCQRSTL